MQLPFSVVCCQMLILGSSRNDCYSFENWQKGRHEPLGAELDPAFSCVCYNECLSVGHTQFQYIFGDLLEFFDLIHDIRLDLRLGVESACRVNETSTENGVVPVKDNHCLV
jgi:hypothetical protein